MTATRLREIAADCEDTSFVASEDNARELRALADQIERAHRLYTDQYIAQEIRGIARLIGGRDWSDNTKILLINTCGELARALENRK